MLNIFEKCIYFILFILNKYIPLQISEYILNYFENRMIQKYISNKKVTALDIPTIQPKNLNNRRFLKISNNYRRPVLIKGFMKKTNAVAKWDLKYLDNIIGDYKINAVAYDSNINIINMPFNEFVSRSDEELYINNNHTILSKFPQLFNDISERFNALVDILSSTNLRNIHIANLFIGNNNINKKPSGSNMHCGGSGNFFCQIKGKKTWTLIDPNLSCLLKGRVAKSGIHAQTLFDMPDINIDQYPSILEYLPRYEVTLEPGDVLWNAPWWWHRIRNHDGLSIGMAVRNNKVTKLNLLNNPTYTLSGYTYLVYNTISISLYEKFLKHNKHFTASHEEKKGDNVLYQIEQLVKMYPKSTTLENILQQK